MKLTSETKLFVGIIIGTIIIVLAGIFFFSQPAPLLSKADLIPSGTATQGNPNAKVYLVEFSDFQCPACKAYQQTVKSIVEKNKDKLMFVYRHFPLDQHPFAKKAALSAEAAGVQGKFWEMHDLLFENQEKFSDSIFADLASQLKLDMDKYNKSLQDETVKNKIFADQAFGQKAGVDATPTFFLQGKKLNLFSVNDLTREVQAAIAKAK